MQTYGVDWLTVSFPIEADGSCLDKAGDAGGPVGGSFSRSVTVSSPDGDAWVGLHVYRSRADEWRCSVACNPSRIADPTGYGLVDPRTFLDETVVLLTQVVDEQGIRPSLLPPDWQVRRLDLARDFRTTTEISVIMEALRAPRRAYANTGILYFNPRNNAAESLYVGTGSRMVRLYDQRGAHPNKQVPPGSLRWEAELRESYLKDHGVRTVADLTEAKLDALAATFWSWSRCGVEYALAANVPRELDRLVDHHELSPAKARTLWGDLWAEAEGFSWNMSSKTRKEYDGWKARLGLTATPDLRAVLIGKGGTSRARLDWASGTEVIIAGRTGWKFAA